MKSADKFHGSFITLIGLSILSLEIRSAGASDQGLFSDTNFFPIAVWLQSPSNASAYKNTGINLYVGLWEGPTKDQLDQLKSAGMPALCDQNEFALANLDTYESVIAGWMHVDEPDNAQSDGNGGYGPCIDPDTIVNKYTTWKSRDPDRPVYLNLGQGVSYIDYIGRGSACHARTDLYPAYINGCDIASFDIYPVNSDYSMIKENLWYVAKGIDSLRMWSNYKKKVWCWIECTRIDSSSPAAPSPDQVKSEVWMALAHGANGFGYFCHSWYGGFKEAGWLGNQAMKTMITKVNNRISSLAAVLNSPSISGLVSVETGSPSAPVDISVRNHSGFTYIFAVSMRANPTSATFSIPGLNGGTTIEVLDENRNISATQGKFQDDFSEYGVHLYKVAASLKTNRGFSKEKLPGRGSLRLIPMIQDGSSVHRNESFRLFTIQGRIQDISKNNTTNRRIPTGVYILQTR